MPSPRKPPETRQNSITRDLHLVPRQEPAIVPPPPRGLKPAAKDAWRSFWASPISQLVDHDADMPALKRWAYCLSERERLAPILRAKPLTMGSTGQLVQNPLAATVRDLTREIMSYEVQFGLTPAARLKLGVVLGQAHDALAGLALSAGSDEPETIDLSDFDDDSIPAHSSRAEKNRGR